MKALLTPLAWIFSFGVRLRNFAFDCGLLSQKALSVPVVSVGNISVGGTGKTPFTMALITLLESLGLKVGLISRGYGGTYYEVAEVDISQDWRIFGDEPMMIKRRFPHIPIFLAPKRAVAGGALLKKYKVDVILADDAFQHRYLKRDVDVVLLDATQPRDEYYWLPRGRLRESFASLKRAHWKVITKLNLLADDDMKASLEFLNANMLEPRKILTGDLVPVGLYDPEMKEVEASTLPNILLLSGIGRPKAFEASVKQLLNREIKDHWIFADHHSFREADLKLIFDQLSSRDKIITTEKDFVRLSEFAEYQHRFIIFKVDMQLKGAVDEFGTQISRLVL